MKVDPKTVQVGQVFTVQVEAKTSWLDPEFCRWILRQDGAVVSDRERAPQFERRRSDWDLRNVRDLGVPSQNGEIDDDRFEFSWIFFTPGNHRLSFVTEGSSCPIDRDVELTVNVGSDYSSLDWYLLARPELTVSKKLNEEFFYSGGSNPVRLMIEETDRVRTERVLKQLDVQAWKDLNEVVLGPFLQKMKIANFEIVDVEDVQEWVRNWDERRPESRVLLLNGMRLDLARELIRSGKFVAIGNINMNKIAQFYQDRKAKAEQERANEERRKQQRFQQAQQAILEKQSAIVGVRQTKVGQAGSSLKVCSIRNSSYYGSLIEAYRLTEDFSTWSRARREKGFDVISKNLDEMFV